MEALPTELLLEIGLYLPPESLAALCRVKKEFYPPFMEILYHHENSASALFWAAYHGREETIRLCLRYGVDINTRKNDKTALVHAIVYKQNNVVKLLLETKELQAWVNCSEKGSAFEWALMFKNDMGAELLLERFVNDKLALSIIEALEHA